MADSLYNEVDPDAPLPKRSGTGSKGGAPPKEPDDVFIELPEQVIKPKPPAYVTPGNALFTGVLQGGSMDLWDEGKARFKSITGDKSYPYELGEAQKELKALREAYPGRFGIGEAVGSVGLGLALPEAAMAKVGMSFLKGGPALAKTFKTAAEAKAFADKLKQLSFVKRMGLRLGNTWGNTRALAPAAAKYGAVTGITKSDKPLFDYSTERESPFNAHVVAPLLAALKGTGEGVMSVPFSQAVGTAARPLVAPLKAGTKALGRGVAGLTSKLLFGVEKEAAEHILNNPELYKGPIESAGEIARNRLIPMANKVSSQINVLREQAKNKLKNEHAIDANELEEKLFDRLHAEEFVMEGTKGPMKGKLTGLHGGAPVKVFNNIRQTINNMAGEKGYLTEKELHRLYEKLKPFARWDSKLKDFPKEHADLYKRFRGELNDILKKNTDYNKAMIPVREMTGDINRFNAVIKLQQNLQDKIDPVTGKAVKDVGRYGIGSGTVEGKIKNAPASNEEINRQLISFAEKYAPDQTIIPDLIKRIDVEEHLKKGGSPGFRSMLVSGSMSWLPDDLKAPLLALALASDVAGRRVFKKGAQVIGKTNKKGSDLPRTLLPASINFGAGPASDPYYMGYPFHNISPEEHRQKIKEGKVRKD